MLLIAICLLSARLDLLIEISFLEILPSRELAAHFYFLPGTRMRLLRLFVYYFNIPKWGNIQKYVIIKSKKEQKVHKAIV